MTNSIVWYENTVAGDSVNQVARKSGVPQRSLNRQVTQYYQLSPETSVAIARAYGVSILEALVATGLITPNEAASFKGVDIDSLVPSALERATEAQLTSELTKRLTLLAQIQAARREKTEK
ncbi:helix-turn-helix transcriptional regulator [Mobiluncus mulieris]|uniref:helix-turn-helix domain-containing protein n=1 Tax=Mobiluncus mulieris TaxID=2052 RepID=UPI0014705EE0|nr:helix-turn-helix transcriptional regulator [Mobiluncus mulieris]MCU9995377.1 helix-turn-helix transcriptional regulator [Mobiluncus mulieris]NMW60203.1 helix-turn-helix transcriptional regulator [Mobiluncus mulieris]